MARRVLGEHRMQRLALRSVGLIARLPGGSRIVRAFDFTVGYPELAVSATSGIKYPSPVGVILEDQPPGVEKALLAMGFGFAGPAHTFAPDIVRTHTTDLGEILKLLDSGVPLVAANEAVLVHGPGVARRINETLIARGHSTNPAPSAFNWKFWNWPGWVWALWLGIAMMCAGLGAAAITVGPVLLPYDVSFLDTNRSGLEAINVRLVQFLQHDRITMAGCMAAIGCNDIGFALAMRRGWRWAKFGFGVAGAVGFPTFFLFLGYGFFDPLHFAVAGGFFPLYLLALVRPEVPPTWTASVAENETARRRAVVGQSLMISVSLGVIAAGVVIMTIGLRDVLIPSDRVYLGASQSYFRQQLDGRLLRFVAHDRAGFGGALTSLGVGSLTLSMWGWRAGERSTWWCTFLATLFGFGPALAIHGAIGYTDALHLLPAYLGLAMVGLALLLSRESANAISGRSASPGADASDR